MVSVSNIYDNESDQGGGYCPQLTIFRKFTIYGELFFEKMLTPAVVNSLLSF